MGKNVWLFGLVVLGACGEEPVDFVPEEAEAGLRVYCAIDCVRVDVQGSYSVSESGGRVTVMLGTTTYFSYDIDGVSDDFGSWADSEWLLLDCDENLVATYGLGPSLTATTSGTGTLTVSSGSTPIIRVETQLDEYHDTPKI